jgi:hypothetical protein
LPVFRLYQRVVLAAFAACSTLPLLATSILQPSFDQLVQQADYIVHAKVKSVTAEWKIDGSNKHIVTKVELDITEVVAGTPPQPLVLEMLGGKIGDRELRVDGAPKFNVGDEDVLFVHGNGLQFSPLVAMEYGRYRVSHDPTTGVAHMARDNGAPLYSEQEVGLPMGTVSPLKDSQPAAQPLTPDVFKNRIRSSRQNNLRSAK